MKREFLVHIRPDWVPLLELSEAGVDREDLGVCCEAGAFELCCIASASWVEKCGGRLVGTAWVGRVEGCHSSGYVIVVVERRG